MRKRSNSAKPWLAILESRPLSMCASWSMTTTLLLLSIRRSSLSKSTTTNASAMVIIRRTNWKWTRIASPGTKPCSISVYGRELIIRSFGWLKMIHLSPRSMPSLTCTRDTLAKVKEIWSVRRMTRISTVIHPRGNGQTWSASSLRLGITRWSVPLDVVDACWMALLPMRNRDDSCRLSNTCSIPLPCRIGWK